MDQKLETEGENRVPQHICRELKRLLGGSQPLISSSEGSTRIGEQRARCLSGGGNGLLSAAAQQLGLGMRYSAVAVGGFVVFIKRRE